MCVSVCVCVDATTSTEWIDKIEFPWKWRSNQKFPKQQGSSATHRNTQRNILPTGWCREGRRFNTGRTEMLYRAANVASHGCGIVICQQQRAGPANIHIHTHVKCDGSFGVDVGVGGSRYSYILVIVLLLYNTKCCSSWIYDVIRKQRSLSALRLSWISPPLLHSFTTTFLSTTTTTALFKCEVLLLQLRKSSYFNLALPRFASRYTEHLQWYIAGIACVADAIWHYIRREAKHDIMGCSSLYVQCVGNLGEFGDGTHKVYH